MPQRPIVLALPITSAMFSGKSRSKGQLTRAISVESSMRVLTGQEQTRLMRRKKRYEEWDAKGGFSLRIDGAKDGTVAKSITDAFMARALGVEPGTMITSRLMKKRAASTSPMESSGDWSLKRNKSVSSHELEQPNTAVHPEEDQDMDVDGMGSTGSHGSQVDPQKSGAVDPSQPQSSL